VEWEKVREGVFAKHLAKDAGRGLQMDLMKISPNFVDTTHYHNDFEWAYVLDGSLEDEKGKHVKGDFLLNEKDSEHRPRSKEGCTLLIVWCGSVRAKR
jgi:anti-sigma factor ChrR (cupin superfamily)